ncbi:MAG: UDP-N-acetylglucosamine 2-epimerase (non-hydrolyzing) [Solirubrobacteraceae bacterium]
MSRRILCVMGARPNFVKVAPVIHALAEYDDVEVQILHTGQHYDHALSGSFLEQLRLPTPDHVLGVGSGTHGEQTAAVIVGVERVLAGQRFDAVLVPGDVNSTLGAALAAAKSSVAVIHLESGLRSRDRTMPEELNRLLTDSISDLLLCHCQEAVDNLLSENVAPSKIALVGNTMIDSLFLLLDSARAGDALARQGVAAGEYVLATLHRPALVDHPERLGAVIAVLAEVAQSLPVILPVHPRTRARLTSATPGLDALQLVEPLEYLEFMALEADARFVITDSGGVQEETSALGVPCITYRENTERAVTVELGTNRLVGMNPEALRAACGDVLAAPRSASESMIPLWDGHAGPRAAAAVVELLDTPADEPAAAL